MCLLNWDNRSIRRLPLPIFSQLPAVTSVGSSWLLESSSSPNGRRSGQKLRFSNFLLMEEDLRRQSEPVPKGVSWLFGRTFLIRQRSPLTPRLPWSRLSLALRPDHWMTVNIPIPFSISNTSPRGVQSIHNLQEAVRLHSMDRTTRRSAIGEGPMEPIHILGGLLPSSASHDHHRHPLPLAKVSPLGLGETGDLESVKP